MTSIAWYYIVYTLAISCNCEQYDFGSTTDVRTLNGSLNQLDGSHICKGAMQVDSYNDSQLLVAVCNLKSLTRYSGIGFMPMPNFDRMTFSEVTIFYGDPSQTWDTPKQFKDGNPAIIVFPTYLIQKKDAIYFIEDSSCLRMVNRTTGNVTTLIGNCGYDTMGYPSSLVPKTDEFGGMVITENESGGLTFYFAITYIGICTWNGDKSSRMEPIIHHAVIGTGFPKVFMQTLFFMEYGTEHFLFHKITQGLNRYKLTNKPGINDFRDKPWLTKLITSRFGSSNYYDPEARCVFPVNMGFSSEFTVVFSLSSDKSVLMITELHKHRIYFLKVKDLFADIEPCNLKFEQMCDSDVIGAIDGNRSTCAFCLLADTIWFNDSRVLTADYNVRLRTQYLRTFNFTVNSQTTTIKPDTPVSDSSDSPGNPQTNPGSSSTQYFSTSTLQDVSGSDSRSLSGGEIAGIVIGVVVPLAVITGILVILVKHKAFDCLMSKIGM